MSVVEKVFTRLVLVQLLFGSQWCGAKGLLVCAFVALFYMGHLQEVPVGLFSAGK